MFVSFAFLFAIGLALSLLKYPTGNPLVSFGLPFVVGVSGVTAYRVLKWAIKRPRHFYPHSDVKYLAFLGLAILLVGVFVSSSMEVSVTETVHIGESLTAQGLKFSIIQIATSPDARQIFLPPYGMVPESIDSKITYTLGDEPSSVKVLFVKYYPALDRFVPTASISSSFLEDTYIVASPTESVSRATALAFRDRTTATPTDISITVMRIPAVSLVWLGVVVLMSADLPFILLPSTFSRDRANERSRGNEASI
jgi:cytochrome c biogenesis factor